ncbi:MAG TPA: N-acetyl-D-Glu racemase DgcA [Kiloniellales bacterium]|nr:N-acetyl-D-Glu racemase DgcA [Kiloniellales bacterium]
MNRRLTLAAERFPTRGSFTISRSTVTAVDLVVATLEVDGARGRGECRPYARYGESPASVLEEIERLRGAIEDGMTRADLQAAQKPGAARNALDCALWDLEAKQSGKTVWQLAGLPKPRPVVTAYTLSLDSPEAMARAAAANRHRPLLKLKLAGPEDLARVAAVRAAAPEPRLIVDANEGWTLESFRAIAPRLVELGVALVEQPLPAAEDAPLAGQSWPLPLCADESSHDRASLAQLVGRYSHVNVKLDKTGGLTEALAMVAEARRLGFGLMVGCMVASSLAMAPALLLAEGADYVDLDGPLLLAEDRPEGLRYDGSTIHPATAELWG